MLYPSEATASNVMLGGRLVPPSPSLIATEANPIIGMSESNDGNVNFKVVCCQHIQDACSQQSQRKSSTWYVDARTWRLLYMGVYRCQEVVGTKELSTTSAVELDMPPNRLDRANSEKFHNSTSKTCFPLPAHVFVRSRPPKSDRGRSVHSYNVPTCIPISQTSILLGGGGAETTWSMKNRC